MSTLPSYLNEEFFRTALANTLKTNVEITDLKIERNTEGGNYSSIIYRASIKYKQQANESNETVVKLLVKDLFESLSDNSREHFMYETVLPEMNETLLKFGYSKELSPKVYFAKKSTNETHIFEDLNARDYKICDRLVGFNEAQTKMVFTKLGQFHAASMIYKDEHPEIVAGMKEFFCKSNPDFMAFILTLINDNTAYVAKIVETWPDFSAIAEKMRKNTAENFKQKFLAILNKEDAEIRVIAHGDLWIKNILILENADNVVQDAIFLDYQNCFDGSPAFDINNLLMTSVHLDVLQTKRMELIQHYYNSFTEALKKLNYPTDKIPSMEKILSEIKRTEYFTYYDLIFAFPQTNLSEELAEGMDIQGFFDFECMERNRKDMYSNRRVLETYAHVLKRLDALGVLD